MNEFYGISGTLVLDLSDKVVEERWWFPENSTSFHGEAKEGIEPVDGFYVAPPAYQFVLAFLGKFIAIVLCAGSGGPGGCHNSLSAPSVNQSGERVNQMSRALDAAKAATARFTETVTGGAAT